MLRPGRYLNTAAMGGAPTPLTIMGANLVAWWNADSATKITTTGAGVSSWLDEVAAYDLVQATDADRPVWSATSFNGRGGVTFDGTSDYLRVAVQPAAFPVSTATSEVWVILDQLTSAADTTTREIINYGGAGSVFDARRVRRLVSGGVNRVQISANSSNPTNANVDLSGRHYIRAQFVNGAIQPDVDGVAGTSGAPTLATTASLVTVSGNTAVPPSAGFLNHVLHQVFVLDATPSAGQLSALNAYCAARV